VSPVPAVLYSNKLLLMSVLTERLRSPVPRSPGARTNVYWKAAEAAAARLPANGTVALTRVSPVRVLTTITWSLHGPPAEPLPVFASCHVPVIVAPDWNAAGVPVQFATCRSGDLTS